MIFIRRNRRYIQKYTVSPGNIYRSNVPYHIPMYPTNVPYHIPCHIIFPPHRAIIPHQTNINSYRTNVPYHIPCHVFFPPHSAIIPPTYHITYRATPHTMPYRTVPHTISDNIILSIPYPTKIPTLTWRQKIHTNSKIKILTKNMTKNVHKSQKWISGTRFRYGIQSKLS